MVWGVLERRWVVFNGLCLILSLLLSGAIATASAGQLVSDTRPLEQGKPVEREIKGGEVHTYQITLSSGQFLRLVVEQRGIDLVGGVYTPSGDQIIEATTLNRQQGPKLIFILAESSGNYRFEVRPADKEINPGRYTATIEELRQATSQDRNHMAARKAFADGERLRQQPTKESLLQALEKYETVLPHWQAMGDREGEAATLNGISAVCFSFGDNQKGLEYLSQALRIWRTLGNRYWEVATLNSMGNAYNLLGENQKALDYYSQALLLINAVGDRKGEAVTLNGIGKVYSDLGESLKALNYYTEALALRRATSDRRGEAITLHNIGSIYDNMLENQKAIDYYTQAIAIFREVNDQRGEASSLNNSGRIYVDTGEYQKALDCFNRSLSLRQTIGDKRGEALTLNNIGYIYLLMSEKREKSSYFIGSAYSLSNYKQQALNNLTQALPIWRTVGDPIEEAATLNAMAKVYAAMGDFQKARDFSNQAQALKQNAAKQSSSRPGETVAIATPLPPPPPPPEPEPVKTAQNTEKESTPPPVVKKESVSPPVVKKESAPAPVVKEEPQKTEKDTARPRFTQQRSSTPAETPQVTLKVEKKELPPPKVEKKEQPVPKVEKKEEKSEPETAEQKQPAKSAAKGKYVIQVGSSPDRSGAESLLSRLKNAGLEGYIVQANLSGKGIWYRVRTGHFEHPDEAKKAALDMKSKGLIADYFITTD